MDQCHPLTRNYSKCNDNKKKKEEITRKKRKGHDARAF